MSRAWIKITGTASLACLAACGSPGVPTDAALDQGAPDAGLEWPELQFGATADPTDVHRIGPDAVPADYSCLDVGTAPIPGLVRSVSLVVQEFQTRAPRMGACVHIYADNRVVPSDTCAATDLHTDAMGIVTFDMPVQSPFAARIFPAMGASDADTILESETFDIVAAPTPPAVPYVIVYPSRQTYNLVAPLWARSVVAGAGIIGVRILDCLGRAVYGARVRLARADGTYVTFGTSRTDPFVGYFDAGNLPSRTQQWTHIGALAALGNVRLSEPGEPVLIEVWGRPPGASEPRVVGCGGVQLVGDGAAFLVELRPLRADSPTCPGR